MIKKSYIYSFSIAAVAIISSLFMVFTIQVAAQNDIKEFDQQAKRKLGGEATVFIDSANAYSSNSANMSSRRKGDFLVGNDFFEDPWVIAPSSTKVRDGIGALFNVSACQSCHINDGGGHGPMDKNDGVDSLLVRLSLAPTKEQQMALNEANQAKINEPVYGGQIQNRAVPGVRPEAKITVDYKTQQVEFSDGEIVELRKPVFSFTKLGYGNFNEQTIFSPRVAPPMIGMGLLEAVSEVKILEYQDIDDIDGDGISGKANWSWHIDSKKMRLGRFGLKAGQPTVEQQVADAFNGDMGLTSRLFPVDSCTETQVDCKKAPNGNDNGLPGDHYEVRDDILEFVTFYSRNLAVPARRDGNSESIKAGEDLFNSANCSACHRANMTTQKLGKENIEQSQQLIWPYTDLLLHDMGKDLADFNIKGEPVSDLVEYQASASEWRTPPLWGIGLRQVVDDNATFLHDGRARTILEAVLWHGGEAQASKEKVLEFDSQQRQQLIDFLNSL